MEPNPLISIAVPVYNSAKFLNDCLSSLIAQTYSNLEIVVLNNGSTDTSLQIIEEFAKKDKRIKYYTISHVPTEAWSRNNAYLRTTAEWVIPVDSDDTIEPEYVEKLWKRQIETGAEWVGATMTFQDDRGNNLGRIPKSDFDYSLVIDGKDSVILTLGKWTIGANGALIKRVLLPCIENGDSKPLFNVEYDTRVILYKARKVAFVDAKYYFGYNPNSVGRKPSFTKVTYVLYSLVGLLPFIQEKYNSSSREVKIITETCSSFLIRSFKNYLKHRKMFSKEQRLEYKSMFYNLYENIHLAYSGDGIVSRFVKSSVIWLNIILLKIF